MMWASLTEAGRVAAFYSRQASAEINGGGRPAVPAPPSTAPVRDWRFELWSGWTIDPVEDPSAIRAAARTRDQKRRDDYSLLDRDIMLEVCLEAVLALVTDPAVAALLRPSTLAKMSTLNERIAAVKSEHP